VTARTIGLMLVAAAAIADGGCRATPPPPDRTALRPVAEPDLTRAAEPVRRQLRARYASLNETTSNPSASTPDLANAFGEMGKLLMAAEFREQAEACLVNAETLAPGEFKWPYYLGHLYKSRGDAAQSAAAFERALRMQPDDPATLIWLGNAYLDQGRPDAAQSLFERAAARQPQSPAVLFGLGRAALARSDYAPAVRWLEQALTVAPREPPIHYPLAMAYRGLGQTGKAEEHMRLRGPGDIRPPDPLMADLETILESAVAYEVRGAKALDDRDWKAAAAAFRKGIELAPREPSLHHKLGTALILDGDAPGASEEFTEALRLSPTFAKAHYSLGILLASSGHTADAVAHLTEAVRDDPSYVEARVRLADVLRHSGRPAESLAYYDQAATLDPRSVDAPLGLAMALADLRRYREARDRLAQDVKQYPDQPIFAHALVRLLVAAPDASVRDGQKALALMREILAREPRTVDVNEMMAMTQAELGQYGDAVIWQREALSAAERLAQPDLDRRLADTLALYERRQPCRTPWSDDSFAAR
jgi:tetratricopeptide (TPR) repeat protein